MKFETPKEEFSTGSFGDENIDRNQGTQIIAANTSLFSKIISETCVIIQPWFTIG